VPSKTKVGAGWAVNDGRGFAVGAGCLLLLRGLPADSVRMRCTIRETDGTSRRSRHEDGILWRRDQTRKQSAGNENKAQGKTKSAANPNRIELSWMQWPQPSTLKIGPKVRVRQCRKGRTSARQDDQVRAELVTVCLSYPPAVHHLPSKKNIP
jgi:hypothetical protein